MNDFIHSLNRQFEINLVNSPNELRGKSTYHCNENGEIDSLVLKRIGLNDLGILVPIWDSLEKLSLQWCEINDLKLLSKFPHLREVDIKYTPIPQNEIEFLRELSNLRKIEICGTKIENTTFFNSLLKLEEIILSGNDNLNKIEGINNLNFLSKLEMEFHQVNSFENIENCKSLTSLNVRAGQISNFNGIEKFPELINLQVDSNSIEKIEGLSKMTNLKKLNISTSQVEKIEGLNELINLEVLNLHNQYIEQINGLSSLTSLKQLNLSENRISKVDNLENLVNLELILLDSNDIVEFNPLFLNSLINKCEISMIGNPIKSIPARVPENVNFIFEDENWVPKSI